MVRGDRIGQVLGVPAGGKVPEDTRFGDKRHCHTERTTSSRQVKQKTKCVWGVYGDHAQVRFDPGAWAPPDSGPVRFSARDLAPFPRAFLGTLPGAVLSPRAPGLPVCGADWLTGPPWRYQIPLASSESHTQPRAGAAAHTACAGRGWRKAGSPKAKLGRSAQKKAKCMLGGPPTPGQRPRPSTSRPEAASSTPARSTDPQLRPPPHPAPRPSRPPRAPPPGERGRGGDRILSVPLRRRLSPIRGTSRAFDHSKRRGSV